MRYCPKKKRCPGTAFLFTTVGAFISARQAAARLGRIWNPPLRYNDENFSCNFISLRPRPAVYSGGQSAGGAVHYLVLRLLGLPCGRGRHGGTVLPGAAAADAGISGGGHVGHGAGRRHRTGGRCHESGLALSVCLLRKRHCAVADRTSSAANACCCWRPAACWPCLCGTAN